MDTKSLCVDCKWFRPEINGFCWHSARVEPVNGHTMYTTAELYRGLPLSGCGEEGKFFELNIPEEILP